MSRPWADPAHPGNKLRPRLRCAGCGAKGCITHWGPWCFDCNVKRMDYLDGQFAKLRIPEADAPPAPADRSEGGR